MFSLTRVSFTLCLAAGVAIAAEPASGTALSKVNVFAGPATTAAAQAANETIEFAGISSVGKHTEYIFIDKTTKKNHWIAKGETKEGITVLNYDDQRQEAVVKVNGTQKTLALRKASGPANTPGLMTNAQAGLVAPSPLPQPAAASIPWSRPEGWNSAPAAPAPTVPAATPPPAPKPETPSTPEAIAKAETEARMLVSDLLEIGMAQRKAYEEQQRKAATENKTDQNDPTAQTQPPKQ